MKKLIKKIKLPKVKFLKAKPRRMKLSIVVAIVLIALVIGGGYCYFKVFLPKKENAKIQSTAENVLKYINENLLLPGYTASIVKAEKESGVIKIRIKVGEQEFDSYVSLDGKYFFPSAFEVGKKPEETAQNDQNQPSEENAIKSCEDVPKNDSPLVEAFVVSNCPFGIQMQRILSEIVKNIPELKKYIKVEYLGSVENGKVSSMHGEDEAKENLRQMCIREEQNDKYWDYVSCYIKDGDVEGCLKEAKVNSSKLDDCLKTKGIDYAQKDFSQQDKYGASGSPTLVLNGKEVSEFNFGGRTAEAVKTLLCCGFTKTPEFCNKKLSTSEAATSFSESYEGKNGSSQGSCGQ